MKQTEKTMILLCYGSWGYPFLEFMCRGRSHWSMALAGGICFALLGMISDRLRMHRLPVRCAACAAAITCVEFIFGCIFNLGLQLQVWDYSNELWNLAGQICLRYSLLWIVLCAPCIRLADSLKIQCTEEPDAKPACKRGEISI